MTGGISIRAARRADCRTIARLFSMASDGVSNYLWTKLAEPGEDILDVGQRRYEREDAVFSYGNCRLAESDGKIVGMLMAFPMHVDPDDGPETDPVLAPYSELEEDGSYYVCGVAVLPEYRGAGIGSRLLDLAEQQAREQGFDRLSLVVFEQNEGAKRLYERYGYRETARARVVSHPLIRYTGDALLMVKQLP